jgi:hypothetical protein
MGKISKDIKDIEVQQEFRECPACDYQRGFHTSLIRQGSEKQLWLVLICPSCGIRYDIGKLSSACVFASTKHRRDTT